MVKRILILLILFSNQLVSVYAQRHTIDSISAQLYKSNVPDSNKVLLLNALSYAYRETDSDSAVLFGQQALTLSEDLSILNQKAWALSNISSAYWMKARYGDALQYAQKALNYFEELKDNKGIAQCYNSIANIYNMEGDQSKSLEFYQKSINIYERLDDDYNINRAYANVGRTYYMLGDFQLAMENMKKVSERMQDNKSNMLYAIVLNTSGDIYQGMQNYDLALKSYKEALEITESLKIPRIITYSTRGISELYQLKGDIERSNFYALKTLEISKEIGYLENVKNAAFILSENYKSMRDFSQAYNYFIEYTSAKDSMFNITKERELQKMQENYEIAQNQKEIQLLKTEKELREEESNKQKIVMYALIIVTLLIVILVIVLYRRNQLKIISNQFLRNQKQILEKQNVEIKEKSDELIEQSEELKKASAFKNKLFSIVSHDLKSPFITLLSVTELLDYLSPDELKNAKKDLQLKINNILEMLNNLLFWTKNQIEGVKVEKEYFDVNELIDKNINLYELLASEKKITIKKEDSKVKSVYADINQIDCVIRNLINNAIKFTNISGNIAVGCKEENDKKLHVWVKDDGVGMSAEDVNNIIESGFEVRTIGTANEMGSGIGLFLCKEFVENNGGRIWIESEPNAGTTFSFTIPYELESKLEAQPK